MGNPPINLKQLEKSNWQTYCFDRIAKNISERVDPAKTDLQVYIGLEHIIKRSGLAIAETLSQIVDTTKLSSHLAGEKIVERFTLY